MHDWAVAYKGYNGTVLAEGDHLIITHSALVARSGGLVLNQPRRIPLQAVSGVQLKEASPAGERLADGRSWRSDTASAECWDGRLEVGHGPYCRADPSRRNRRVAGALRTLMSTIGTRHEQGAVSPVSVTRWRNCFPVMARLLAPKCDTLDRPPGASAPRATERRSPTPSLAGQPTLDRPM